MPLYRFYTIKQDGHVAGPPVEFDARIDLDAIKQARSIQDGLDIEIWQAERVVAYLVPEDDRRTG